jgi:hypothetical protein
MSMSVDHPFGGYFRALVQHYILFETNADDSNEAPSEQAASA